MAFLATAIQPLSKPLLAAIDAVVATAASFGALGVLLSEAGLMAPLRLGGGGPGFGRRATTPAESTQPPPQPKWSRRKFLFRSVGFLVGAIGVGFLGRVLLDRQHPGGAPVTATLPRATEVAASLTAEESLAVPDITPIVVPNDSFYELRLGPLGRS